MKHNYRDHKGRFAKRPVGCPDTVTSAKELPLVQPKPMFIKVGKNREGVKAGEKISIVGCSSGTGKSMFGGADCPICKELEKAKEPEKPKCEYDGDPDEFFAQSPSKDKPQFLRLEKNQPVNIRVFGTPLPYRQHFSQVNEPVQRYMVHVYDHADGKYKVLSCGKMLMRELVRNTNAISAEIEEENGWIPLLDLVRNIFDGTPVPKKKRPSTLDFRVERQQEGLDPRTTRYKVSRVEA
jgi:hypothetical protein